MNPNSAESQPPLRRELRRTARARKSAVRKPASPRMLSPHGRRVQSLTASAMVVGMLTTAIAPAYGAWSPSESAPRTLSQVAEEDAQSLVLASEGGPAKFERESYSATTREEIVQQRAAEEAAARAKAAATATAALPATDYVVPEGSGDVRWPVGGPFRVTDRFGARGGAHMGTDMVAAGGTRVFTALDGVVTVSQDGYGAYGVTVVVESQLDGQTVKTVYPHMQTGSRQVVAGDTVSAGQTVGLVGSTGRSTANHLHFEVYVNGTAVDSLAWLEVNAG